MSRTYKAVQVTNPGTLELVERPIVEPAFGQVSIRVEACGVCHTDAFTVEGGFPGLTYPRVPGHEVIGKIEAVGPGVQGWKEGERVGVGYMGGHCGHCENCRRGDFVNCQNQPISGHSNDGGYAEMMIARASGLAAIPDDLLPTEAAPLLCAGLTTFNGLRNSKARPGELVAIQGVGGLGHLGIQFAQRMGFQVAAIARGPEKESLARKLGAHHYIDSNAQDPVAALQALGGARLILATAANSKSMSPLLGGLAPRGQLIVAGAGGNEPIEVNPVPLLFGMRSIAGTMAGSSIDAEDTLSFSSLQKIRPMIETVPLANAAEAYARMIRNEARFRIVLVTGPLLKRMKTNSKKKETKLPKPIETYIRAINARDADAFQSSFAHDAVVNDVGREIRGIAAITEWANHEIFAVNVTLEVMDAAEHDGQTIVTVKIDGTFDRTGLPDPLLMDHCFTIAGGKIAFLSCRLAGEAPRV